jgi:hypothetical protein
MKKVLENNKWFLLVLIVILGLFYWLQYRPTQIKRRCSWVEDNTKEVPFRPALSLEEMEKQGFLLDCNNLSKYDTGSIKRIGTNSKEDCIKRNEEAIKLWGEPQPEILSEKYTREATKEEYELCLRKEGL